MRHTKTVSALAVIFFCLTLAPAAQGAKVLALGGLGLGQPCQIRVVDTATGTSTFLADTGFNCTQPASPNLTVGPNGLAYDFGPNRVYFAEITTDGGANLHFIDLDDTAPFPVTCAHTTCDSDNGAIGFPIDNAAFYIHEYYFINPSSNDLYKVSFDAAGKMMGPETLVSGDVGTGDWGFGDIVITDGGIVGGSANRTALAGDAGCASISGGRVVKIFTFNLNTSTFNELSECDDTPVLQIALGGDSTPPPGPPSGGLPETLFGTTAANEMFLINQGTGTRMLIHEDIPFMNGATDWSDYIPFCECERCEDDDDDDGNDVCEEDDDEGGPPFGG